MGTVRRVGVGERRARLARRHHLAAEARAGHVVTAARDLVGLHATDPASVVLAAAARVDGFVPADLERACYDDRALVRALGMRRTMFVLPPDLLDVVQASCTDAIARTIRRRLVQDLEAGGVVDADGWLEALEDEVVAVVAARGELAGRELAGAVPGLRTKLSYAPGKAYGGDAAITTRVLTLLGAQSRLVRGRPLGGWTSGQHRWAAFDLPRAEPPLEASPARAELARRYLAAFAPATVDDLRWWTGWTLTETRRALVGLETAAVDLDGAPGVVLADDVEVVDPPGPWAALLPALDPTPMGWTARGWYLGDHRAALFDRNGNVGPTVWVDGRIVGGWAQRAGGEVLVRLLEDVGADARALVDDAAERTSRVLGDVRVVPRFRTPLEQELAAS